VFGNAAMDHDGKDMSGRAAQARSLGTAALRLAQAGWRRTVPALAAGWRMLRPVLRHALEIVLAVIIVFEEWGWRPLAELLGRLARWRPWAVVESVIVRLPPYAALLVFALPTALLLPLKLLALFLVAGGHTFLAAALFVVAKVVGTALVARLFMLTQPALMQIGWFAWGYNIVIPWKEKLIAEVRASWAWRVGRVMKERARRLAAAQWRRLRPTVMAWRAQLLAEAARLRIVAQRLVRRARARLGGSLG
jgi:hypothetical protein